MPRMLSALWRSLRPAQWVKNLFVLAPLVFAHRAGDSSPVSKSLLAVAIFCLTSSAVYLWNDVRDREADRRHPLKSRRPVASGALPVAAAVAAAIVLGALALAGALVLGRTFLAAVAGYLALNVLYSYWLKHIVILDVMSIAAGFVLRVLAGAVAIEVEISRWLVLCTTFLALFLAFSKRRHELDQLGGESTSRRRVLEHYSAPFLDQMINVVTASTVISYTLYAADPETAQRLGTPHLLWTVPMVLFGIFRFLYLLYLRTDAASPTESILTDGPFVANVALWTATVFGLIYAR